MELNNLTLGQIKEIQSLVGGSNQASPNSLYKVGEKYLVRTVTHYYTGKLKAVSNNEMILEDACWIADTGRFYDCLKDGLSVFKEAEPFVNDAIINRAAVVDATVWNHDLPMAQIS
jgi:hypothetical protein